MSWTDERVELLKKLWLQGLSASRIATELADGITRNAVIGKVHRLGLSGRPKSAAAPIARPPARHTLPPRHVEARATAPTVIGNTALALAPSMERVPMPRPIEDVVIPISERVTIMELREVMCRWPLGDPTSADFRFCGARKTSAAEGPYCANHARVAYQPMLDRRRERDRDRRLQRLA